MVRVPHMFKMNQKFWSFYQSKALSSRYEMFCFAKYFVVISGGKYPKSCALKRLFLSDVLNGPLETSKK
jgi:hypothetical protein